MAKQKNAKGAASKPPKDEAEARRASEADQQKAAGALESKGRDGQGADLGQKAEKAGLDTSKMSAAELRDELEAQIVRHERHFEDFTGQLCTVKPVLTPMGLHERRLVGSKVQQNAEATPDDYREAIGLLAGVEFIYPEAR